MSHKLIIALDNLSPQEAKTLVESILTENKDVCENIIFKIHDIVSLIGLRGVAQLFEGIHCKFMLDLKWHDIPNTIKNYVLQLSVSGLGDKIEYITIHASWWSEMLKVAVESKDEYMPHIKFLGITALTSLDDQDTGSIYDNSALHTVLKLTKIAIDSWIEWIVCSSHEANILRGVFGQDIDIITPGIRFLETETSDQKRVMTPGKAITQWITHMVMGRPIIWAIDSSKAVQQFFSEIQNIEYIQNQDYNFEKILYTGEWKNILSYIGAFYFRPEGGKYCRFTSKVISNAYINIGAIERNYLVIDRATSELAQQIRWHWIQADVVVGAQMWSVRISLALAKKLWIEQSIYTEKTENDNNSMALKRHVIDLRWKKIILSEDIVSRGTTIAKMRTVLENLWWEVVAIACVWNRYEQNSQKWIPIISCFVPPKFELFWDESTPVDQRKDFPKLPEWSSISEKPKNDWGELVESMRD